MGQIQSSVNQLAMSAIGASVAKSVQNQQKLEEQKVLDAKAEKEAQIKAAEAEKKQQKLMYNTVAGKLGAEATSKLSDAEIAYKYKEFTAPQQLAADEEYDNQGFWDMIHDDINNLVEAGWDEQRAIDYTLTGVDPKEYPEAFNDNSSNYDAAKGKKANQKSLKESVVKGNSKKQFKQRLENAKQRKLKKQNVGGRK